jgi:tetratricopeptide (TPR) repeat protein/tRNA A-37 threonylcarbamoyl transferase component Bud32
MDTDRNLLFGVLALQADLINQRQFAEACTAWSASKDTPLADLLLARGWLTPADRADVEKLLDRKLKKHGGDAHAGLAEVTTDPVRQSLAGVSDPDVRHSLAFLTPPPQGHVLLGTTDFVPEARERYTLSRLHATGGIGRVWLARDDSLGRDVALKELRPERASQPTVWARFLREARITGQLEHPGIVPIYEVGRRPDDQGPFYTMRFVRGRTLAEAVASYHQKRSRGAAGPLELRELLTAFIGVCNAAAYAHSRGVLHRDLKPQNVVLGDYGEVIVLDWGLARLLDQPDADAALPAVAVEGGVDDTMQGQVLGTPAYMAPEQAEGRLDQLSPATDVYGLGAILYEVLTGRAPFTGADTIAVLRQVVHDLPPRPREVVAGTPTALEGVCLKALAKKPAERYASAKELAGEVQHWLAGEPVAAYREPWTMRVGRWVKRHRVLVTSAAAAGLVALVGLAVVLGLQARANRELRAANERETARFDLAMDAIKLFHGEVSEDLLLKEKQFDGLRTKLLRGAADFYGKLDKLLEGQTDRRSRAALGKAYEELGTLTDNIGSKPEALAVHQKALAVRRELAADPRAEPETKADVAQSLIAVGNMQDATGDTTGSLAVYEEARAILQKLTDLHPAVTQFLRDLARSHGNIGNVLSRTGKLAEALAAHEQARALRQKLADANPAVTGFQSALASSHEDIGMLLFDTGKPAAALAAYEQARALRQKLADTNPAVTGFQSALASSHDNIGSLLSKTGKPGGALVAYEQARALRQKLAETNPAVTHFQSALAGSLNNIGLLLSQTGKTAEGLAAYEQAQSIFQKLADANPTVTYFQSALAMNHINLGVLLSQTGKPVEALAAYERALVISEKLDSANPTVPGYQRFVAGSLNNIGDLRCLTGSLPEAIAAFERARAIHDRLVQANPTVTDYANGLAFSLTGLGRAHQRAGQPGPATADLRRAIAIRDQLSSLSIEARYDLACSHALLAAIATRDGSGLTDAERLAEADKAMDALRRAIKAGYRDIAKMRTDTDLDSLRKREDFQKLMQELEAKGKEGGP